MTPAATGLDLIRDILENPSANPSGAVILMAILAVAVLLAVVLFFLAFVRSPDEYEDEPVETRGPDDAGEDRGRPAAVPSAEEYEYPDLVPQDVVIEDSDAVDEMEIEAARLRAPRRVSRATVVRLAVAFVLVLLVFAAFAATSTDRYCAGLCHAHASAIAARSRDAHAGVPCVSCHEDGSFTGALGAPWIRTGHVLRRVSAQLGSEMGPAPTASCLACHADIRGTTATVKARNISISHDGPLSRGMSCDDCHTSAGHAGGARSLVPMSKCAPCHDGRTAPSKCATCHPADPSRLRRPSDEARTYTKVPLPIITDCGTCHDQTPCDACHGLRLPHTDQFKAWSHARQAAFDGRATCLRCHTIGQCVTCHPGFTPGSADSTAHPADWKTSHQRQKPDADCRCHVDRLPSDARAGGGYCAVCH